ncbi:hypothetical protein RvY_08919 [Ramazzottius varieornatus]|uniref:Uncharacterized protein n=1 Tax=Ramazzottius varieornatus TaxID=947166 RepID=A0A1D1V7I3_RAMVA|nr:hypothetical protein RvY_08919 [Ramazzottius varieornatus]
MVHTFPEEDFCFWPHYVRRLSEDGAHCLCLVSKPWVERIIMENCRSACLTPPDPHPSLSDIEVQLLLTRSDALPARDPWMRLELYRIPLNPSALLNRRYRPEYDRS